MKIEMDNTKSPEYTIKTGTPSRMRIFGIVRTGWYFEGSFYYENSGKMLRVRDCGEFKQVLDKVEFIQP